MLSIVAGLEKSELFVVAEVTPLAGGKIAEHDAADADSFQPNYFESNEFAHAADLPFFPFVEHKAQLIFVLPGDFCGLQFLSVEAESVVQQF